MNKEKRRISVIGIALSTIAIGALIGVDYYFAPDVDVPIGKEQQVDDFGLTVLEAKRMGTRIFLKTKFSNHARRVSYPFGESKVRVFSVDGQELPHVSGGSEAVVDIGPGEDHVQDITVDAQNTSGPYKVRFTTSADMIAELLGTLFHERQHSSIQP